MEISKGREFPFQFVRSKDNGTSKLYYISEKKNGTLSPKNS